LINNLVVPQFLLKRKYVLFVFALIITIASSAWLRALVAAQMNLLYFKTSPIADFTTLYLNSVVNISLWVLLITLVHLEKELDYIENYVAFHRLRKEEKLIVSLKIENNSTDLKIAPLLLVILIENAFKFVSNFAEKDNEISIKISVENNSLNCSVINSVDKLHVPNSNSNGIGILNLKRRLALLYPQKYELTINNGVDFFETILKINLQ
jgi:hypothetical protein